MEQLSQQQTNQENTQNSRASAWSIVTYKRPDGMLQQIWFPQENHNRNYKNKTLERR